MKTIQKQTSIPDIRKHLSEQPRSGLNIRAYCRKNLLQPWVFHYWRKKLANECDMRPKQSDFSSLGVLAMNQIAFEVHLPTGLKVVVQHGATREEFSMAMDVLFSASRPTC
jgi:hypothetical protein